MSRYFKPEEFRCKDGSTHPEYEGGGKLYVYLASEYGSHTQEITLNEYGNCNITVDIDALFPRGNTDYVVFKLATKPFA